jgi:dolichyl-phosphate-mannose--protein O-mannosyl transferase
MAKHRSDVASVAPTPATRASLFTTSRNAFVWAAFLLVALAILRSAITTRLDGFTIDEAYHIAAGTSYVKYHDFRINPEHPPLVKLWVGIVLYATGFRLDPLRQFNDKPGERDFANLSVFRQNDPDSVQRRASFGVCAGTRF